MPLFTEQQVVNCLKHNLNEVMFGADVVQSAKDMTEFFLSTGGYECLRLIAQANKTTGLNGKAVGEMLMALAMVRKLNTLLINELASAKGVK